MSRLEKILIVAVIILVGVLIWQQFFNKTEAIYDPMKNPVVIEAMKKDSIKTALNEWKIKELEDEIFKANTDNSGLNAQIDRLQANYLKLKRQLNIDQAEIKGMDESELEADINKRLKK